MKTLAVCQSNYIPWKGYFDLINSADEFVIYDDVQYTRRDWRNRNKIKTCNGSLWLSIPVDVKGKYFQDIKDTRISDLGWNISHWKTIRHAYGKAPYFQAYKDRLEELYLTATHDRLSDVNRHFIDGICGLLNIQTPLRWSMEYTLPDDPNERLVRLCKDTGATHYLSGPAAKTYLDERMFAEAGIAVEWMDYSGYPEYRQIHPPFEHQVSIIDLIMNLGPDSRQFMKSFPAA